MPRSSPTLPSLSNVYRMHCIPYSGYFSGVIFSWFLWSRGEPRNIYPRKTPRARAQNRRQTVRPRNFFHEIAKITTFTKILPLEKYPLYGIPLEAVSYTVEPPIKDTPNKEHLSIKDKSTRPNSYYTSTFYKGNPSIKDKTLCPNVSFIRRFHCIQVIVRNIIINLWLIVSEVYLTKICYPVCFN